jgi:hypothetical protein
MAPTNGKEPEQEAEQGLPPSIIAQAEAAMYAHLKQRRKRLIRSNTDVRPDASQNQTAQQTPGGSESPLAK